MTHVVYIIDLKRIVLDEPRFKRKNPDYKNGKPCVYVGSSARTAEERFQQHLSGHKANRYARRYGKRLRLKDMARYPTKSTRSAVEKLENAVAVELRQRGWAVWSN